MIVYVQRCREAFADVPIVIGGIEASLRRIAHYDYWSDKVRRSILLDAKADLLVYGNGERQVVEIAHRLAAGEAAAQLADVRGTVFARPTGTLPEGWTAIESQQVDLPARAPGLSGAGETLVTIRSGKPNLHRARTVIRMPDYDAVVADPVLYAHASRILHIESNPGNARALVQRHGDRDVWINPPQIPLTTAEMDAVYELPYTRRPHPRYADAKIPAYDMIKTSVTIMRGCFGGWTFCSITEHEGHIIQNRSEASVLREIETVRDSVPGFTGVISDLGSPTANMYRLACKSWGIPTAYIRRPKKPQGRDRRLQPGELDALLEWNNTICA